MASDLIVEAVAFFEKMESLKINNTETMAIAIATVMNIPFLLLCSVGVFSLPWISPGFGTIKPGLDNAYTSIGSSTFLNANEPSELIWNSALFFTWSRIVFEKSTDE